MIRESALILAAGCLLIIATLFSPGFAHAYSTSTGVPIIAIDGDNDIDVTVNVTNINLNSPYTYGYFLNGGSTFYALGTNPLDPWGTTGTLTFNGGDMIDFALYDSTKYYTLSGDAADSSYSVSMTFLNPVTTGSPQQPAGWTAPYYYDTHLYWRFFSGAVANELELTLNFSNGGNDGLAPSQVPEPSTILMLGGGLVGFAFIRRRLSR